MAYARLVAERFGGEVRGYCDADNPQLSVGEAKFGHDFAVLAERFIVDLRLFHYYGESPVLDFDEAAGAAIALIRYGDPGRWESLP